MASVILASGSQRRIELLKRERLDFTVRIPEVDETFHHEGAPCEVAMYLALKKALSVEQGCEKNQIVLAADTLVVLDNRIYGKPGGKEDCCNMLKSLSGRTHLVITGVTLLKAETHTRTAFYEQTEVTFATLPEEWLLSYIETEEPWDKAGGYAIQGSFSKYIESINGDYDNVMGLPAARVVREIKNL